MLFRFRQATKFDHSIRPNILERKSPYNGRACFLRDLPGKSCRLVAVQLNRIQLARARQFRNVFRRRIHKDADYLERRPFGSRPNRVGDRRCLPLLYKPGAALEEIEADRIGSGGCSSLRIDDSGDTADFDSEQLLAR